jgi:hypothetical protein
MKELLAAAWLALACSSCVERVANKRCRVGAKILEENVVEKWLWKAVRRLNQRRASFAHMRKAPPPSPLNPSTTLGAGVSGRFEVVGECWYVFLLTIL